MIEEGLCGRTTIFEDIYRKDRNGLKTLPLILESHSPLNAAILMLGTNDCKSHYNNCAFKIAKGLGQCVDLLLEKIPAEKILILSPVHLGKEVWMDEYDPEFNTKSVEISGQLEKEYQKIAIKKDVHFLAASDYAKASERDNEHTCFVWIRLKIGGEDVVVNPYGFRPWILQSGELSEDPWAGQNRAMADWYHKESITCRSNATN